MDDRPIILNRDPKEKQIYVGNANYRFDNKTNARGGILSIILGAVSAVAFGACIYGAYRMKREKDPSFWGLPGLWGCLLPWPVLSSGWRMSLQEEPALCAVPDRRAAELCHHAIVGQHVFDRDLKTDWKRRNKCPGPV